MKFTQAFKSFTGALGFKLTEAQLAQLAKADNVDLPDELDDLMDYMANDGANVIKGAMRAEAHNATDKALNEFVELFGSPDDLKEVLKKSGTPTKVREIGQKLLTKYKALETAQKGGDGEGEKKFAKEIETLNAQLREYAEKEEKEWKPLKEKAEKVDRLEKNLTQKELLNRLMGHKSISDEKKAERRFGMTIMADVEDILAREKVRIDPETFKLVRTEDGLPLSKKGTEYTLDNVIDEVANHEDWKKKSNGSPTKDTLPVNANGEVDEATLKAAKALV
ncbi:hypothetical protein BWI93_05420 [Siphonobacter sp. BAB-5385]|uniref:hypothetical protein n=1 Tax=Siphonobacter sp. BAB-5385 TaxID=1864822 RepID=UPI000B9E35D7|nr:hypothetical protein [Siphonobacter sp. BAB-5385]OZI09187.1 hypothetical protein BWI93_05420 [Siphonobacter sp. BAB-5385]